MLKRSFTATYKDRFFGYEGSLNIFPFVALKFSWKTIKKLPKKHFQLLLQEEKKKKKNSTRKKSHQERNFFLYTGRYGNP